LEGNPDATGAIGQLAYQVKKTIGAYAAALGGLDALIFTAGIGENSSGLRSLATRGLGFLGIELDSQKNSECGGEGNISGGGSSVQTLVIPADEERMIASDTLELCRPAASSAAA
jgi:acetate kinase